MTMGIKIEIEELGCVVSLDYTFIPPKPARIRMDPLDSYEPQPEEINYEIDSVEVMASANDIETWLEDHEEDVHGAIRAHEIELSESWDVDNHYDDCDSDCRFPER